jgi:hypothetical protein
MVVGLVGEAPSTVLEARWYDERTRGERILEIPLWEDFPDMPPEEVERAVVLTLLEA